MEKEIKSLSEKIKNDVQIHYNNGSRKTHKTEEPYMDVDDVKEFIKLLKEEDEDYEAKVIGLVWGLNSQEPFNIKFFNNKFNELRLEHYKNKNKLAGSKYA